MQMMTTTTTPWRFQYFNCFLENGKAKNINVTNETLKPARLLVSSANQKIADVNRNTNSTALSLMSCRMYEQEVSHTGPSKLDAQIITHHNEDYNH